MNSFTIAGGSVIILGILSSLATYAMVRSSSKLIKSSYLMFSLGLMIPTQSGMVALFNAMKSLHLYNTTAGMENLYEKILPLSTSAFGTVVIYNAVNIWKDFTYPLLFTQGEKVKTLPIAIYAMKGQYVSDYPTMFAGILIATLPLLLIYIALQKQFIAGSISFSSSKVRISWISSPKSS